MEINKSALRTRLTDEHLHAVLRIANQRKIRPNVDSLVAAKRCLTSSKSINDYGFVSFCVMLHVFLLANFFYLCTYMHTFLG